MARSGAIAHVVAGGFPPGTFAGHDIDYARLRLLQMLHERGAPATVSGDFTDIDKWLPDRKLLITYVAGPYANDQQTAFVNDWLQAGGRWLGLHGSSGGRAVRVDGRRRTMVKTSYHDMLGGFFINHPPVRRFRVDVPAESHPLTKGLPKSFDVVDELYMIELQHPERTDVVLTTELAKDPSPPGFGFVYEKDTALQADGKTRVLGYTHEVGKGGVAYVALGHCHTPESSSQPFVDTSVDPEGKTPPILRGPWETEPFERLLANAIEWGLS
jgi:type 1 glutamine amidotransferase